MAVRGRLKGRRRVSVPLYMLFLGVSACISGYPAGYEDAYVLEERVSALDEGAALARFVDASASDLYAVMDKSEFDTGLAASETVALFDTSDREVLYSKEAFERLYPASVTKVMTALVAIKEGGLNPRAHMAEDIIITESGAILYGIEPGDTLTLEQLLYDSMLPFGNDVGIAIVVRIAGSIDAFTDMMNEGALHLDTTGTHSVSPHGLDDPDHYTTAYDLYPILDEALKYPVFRQIMSIVIYMASYHSKNSEPVTETWKGGNWFMTDERETPGGLKALGGKTGTTKAAGYCLIMASRDGSDKEYISVVLKVDSRLHLYDSMADIISRIVKQ